MSTIRCSVDLPREVVATLGGKSFQTQRLSGRGLNNGVHYTIMFVLPTPKFFSEDHVQPPRASPSGFAFWAFGFNSNLLGHASSETLPSDCCKASRCDPRPSSPAGGGSMLQEQLAAASTKQSQGFQQTVGMWVPELGPRPLVTNPLCLILRKARSSDRRMLSCIVPARPSKVPPDPPGTSHLPELPTEHCGYVVTQTVLLSSLAKPHIGLNLTPDNPSEHPCCTSMIAEPFYLGAASLRPVKIIHAAKHHGENIETSTRRASFSMHSHLTFM